jgi:hypothetical protein
VELSDRSDPTACWWPGLSRRLPKTSLDATPGEGKKKLKRKEKI